MKRIVLACLGVAVITTAAHAQSATPASYVVAAGGATSVTLSGMGGVQYALIGSTTNSGFSYAGVNLAVGTDVQVLSIGVLDGAGQAVVPVTPPFPARDRFYVQAVFSQDNFSSITPTNGVVLVNNQAATLFMPIGGIVTAAGAVAFGTPGMTVTKSGSTYTINHTGLISIPTAIPSVTPTTPGASVTSISTNSNTTVVTFSGDSSFFVTIQPVRR